MDYRIGDEIIVTNQIFESYGKIGIVLTIEPRNGMYRVKIRGETQPRFFLPSSIEKLYIQEIF